MAGMRELLEEMVSKGASDLHLTAGLPPQYRIDGLIASSDFPVLTGEETMRLAYSILNEEQKKRYEKEKELDLSFGVQGISRFRANVFQQRGVTSMAIRQIPYEILTFEELGLPPVVPPADQPHPGPDPGHRPHRQRQVDHPRHDDRHHQHHAQGSHHHHRGPDRVRAPPQELHRQPARAQQRHPQLRRRAEVRAAPGSGRDPDRRDARPRDHRRGADHRRDRAPGPGHAAHQQHLRVHQPHHRRLPGRAAEPGAFAAVVLAWRAC